MDTKLLRLLAVTAVLSVGLATVQPPRVSNTHGLVAGVTTEAPTTEAATAAHADNTTKTAGQTNNQPSGNKTNATISGQGGPSNKTTATNQTSGAGNNFLANLVPVLNMLKPLLPRETAELLSKMTGNQSTWTLQNAASLLIPVLEMGGVRALGASGVSAGCATDLGLIINGIIARETWALKMLDAMFKLPANIYDSIASLNPKALGDYDECLSVRALADAATGRHISGKYCKASFTFQLPPGAKAFIPNAGHAFAGLCVSKSCSAADIGIMISALEKQIMNGTEPYPAEVECAETKTWETDMIVVTIFLALLGAMVVFGTLYDAVAIHLRKPDKDTRTKLEVMNGFTTPMAYAGQNGVGNHSEAKNGVINGGYVVDEKKGAMGLAETNIDTGVNVGNVRVAVESPSQEPKKKTLSFMAQVWLSFSAHANGVKLLGTSQGAGSLSAFNGFMAQVWLSFSAHANGVKLLGTSQGAGSLGAVNGIRFLSMAWVILGHTYYFAGGNDANLLPSVFSKMGDWTFTAIPYAGVSVDSFFTLSGVLVAYLTLRELKKVGGASKMNWFMFYFHRFWRLTPPYMLVLMVGTVVLPYVVQGPMADNNDLYYMGDCRHLWWSNLLYANNYYMPGDKFPCMAWGWYLANDMQFYIISPLILLPFFYNAVAGAIVSGSFLAATIAAVGVVTKNHSYPSQTFAQHGLQPKDGDYYRNLYVPSYARMGPYLVGLITGYILYRCKCKCRMSKGVTVGGWLLCLGLASAVMYGQFTDGGKHIMSEWENVIFMSLFRTVWGIAVCWVIFACATGYGGWINDILAWRAFVPLGRLTYCAYLVHPLVMLVYNLSRRSPIYFNNYEAAYLFLAHLTMSYGVAFVTSLFFESPMMGLEKAAFKKNKK